ncbi:hypothetical protein SGLAM104S_03108 [Streptomyces glaucescens]
MLDPAVDDAGGGDAVRTACRQPSIFGTMPEDSSGSSFSSWEAVRRLITSSLFGQSSYSPSTSVRTIRVSAPSAAASAAAAVSALTL